MASCSTPEITVSRMLGTQAEIFPDYKDIIIPCNIAPMNFNVLTEGEHQLIIEGASSELQVAAKDGLFDIPIKEWRRLLRENMGQKLSFTVARKENGEWLAYEPFTMEISPDSIDSHMAYRLLPPAEQWLKIGIFQRNLESFDQKVIYENKLSENNCINCHTFPARNPDKMMFHLRAKNYNGTAMVENGKVTKLNTKTPETISSLVYPYWHPSERFIVVSTNIIYQSYYYHSEDRMEVFDEKSDVVVWDVERGELFTNELLSSPDAMETLPTFSPDGKTLYFCTAENVDSLGWNIDKLKYSLCSVDFDAETAQIGTKVDTLFNA
ncbi:MAG: PD40 domain-containing protein, partial [Alistipes sp.]|nr:PD40 domain-containing protein [Alistipes sp.]